MPHRMHVLPQGYLADHPVRVTAQRYDDLLRHEVVLNARRTKNLRAIIRRHDPVYVAYGYEVRRDGVVIGVALEVWGVLPVCPRGTWFVLTRSGDQLPMPPPAGLYLAASEAYRLTLYAEQAAAEARRLKDPPEVREAKLRADRLDAEALAGLTFF